MEGMQTESQHPPLLSEVAAAHKELELGPEQETLLETEVKAEKKPSQENSVKESSCSSPVSSVPAPVRSGTCSDRSPSPPPPVWYVFSPLQQRLVHPKLLTRWRAHWINRKPEIRKRASVDWISVYEQEMYEPDLGQFVVLYAFYDKETATTRPGGKVEEESGDEGGGDAWEDDEPMRVIIRSLYVLDELKEVTGIAFPYRECMPVHVLTQHWSEIERHLCHLKEEASKLLNLPDSRSQEVTSGSGIPESVLGVARGREDFVVNHPGGARVSAPIGDRRRPPPQHQRRLILSEEEKLRRRVAHLEMLIQEATLQRIAFNDLWHLYNPGDLLLTDERGYPQLYMVYNVTGGQPRLRNPTESEIRNRGVRVIPARRRIGRRGPRRGWYDAAEGSSTLTSSSSEAYDTTMHDAMVGTCTPFIIDCYAINVDSTGVGTLCSRKQIRKYPGLKSVSDLPLYPLKFHKDAQSILATLQDRGRKFISCTGHRRYDGVTYDTRGIASRERLQGEIYVDAEEYARSRSRFARNELCLIKRTNPVPAEVEEAHRNRPGADFYIHHDHAVDQRKSDIFIEKDPGIQELMTRDEALLMPEKLQLMQHSLQAFSFKSRSWVHTSNPCLPMLLVNIEIENVETIDKSQAARESGFQDLSIPSKHRRLLISLVDNHAIHDDKPDDHGRMNPKPSTQLDLVRGKGLGLIILLHGPPGSGKTSTAETIAAHTGRPLYAITCGDLGETLEDIETRLDVHSKRADKWGAVLLLDEADVFLMKRDWKDTHRNAMVSIFLRTLEYYQGILFLTTNRVGVIDAAFKSRIHVSLRYPKVKLKSTLEIWKSTLNRIERDNEQQDIKVEFDRDELLEFAEEHFENHATTDGSTWNGRQIRNAFQTAIALGQYDRVAKIQKRGLTPEEAFLSGKKKWRVVKLTRKNLETLAETARDFDKYLKSVHRLSDGELARAEDLRDDEFSEFEEEAVGSKSDSDSEASATRDRARAKPISESVSDEESDD
ncbi:AAA family ATPase y4kL [Apiospora rasikravindrae]|uniref:AAA family ATPase y4kL n=1 Tax=Apiospora rasikravindrae TaxID=990691 RepID=A0ABR1SMZ5_9PEZI